MVEVGEPFDYGHGHTTKIKKIYGFDLEGKSSASLDSHKKNGSSKETDIMSRYQKIIYG